MVISSIPSAVVKIEVTNPLSLDMSELDIDLAGLFSTFGRENVEPLVVSDTRFDATGSRLTDNSLGEAAELMYGDLFIFERALFFHP